MICVENVTVRFGGRTVLDRLSFSLAPGEAVCHAGGSGAGETTALNVVLGLIRPDGGTVSGVPDRIAAVFQEDRLCESLGAVRNVRRACPGLDRREIAAALGELGLEEAELAKPVAAFSGGMKRRVAIARAVLAESELLVLDEPFRGLDDDNVARAAAFILRRRAGRAILMVSHSEREAAPLEARPVPV
jgi:NitT/TauT family transport system ATP-binding protein